MAAEEPPIEIINPKKERFDRSSQAFIQSVTLPRSITESATDDLNYQDRAKLEVLRSAQRLQQRGRWAEQHRPLAHLRSALTAPLSLLRLSLTALLRQAGLDCILPAPPRRSWPPPAALSPLPPFPPPAHGLPVSGPLGLLLLDDHGGAEAVARYRRRPRERLAALAARVRRWLGDCLGFPPPAAAAAPRAGAARLCA